MDSAAVHNQAGHLDARTRRLLHDPILPLLVAMAWPNVLVMLAQASTGLIETWWVAKLGTHALAGMALVFPPVMLMQMISSGAVGGGISAAVARALGAGKQGDANALVLHAVIINGALGLLCSIVFLAWGEPIFRLLGGDGDELQAALAYSDVIFSGIVLLWVMNGLASVVRGTGNMMVPSGVICIGTIVLIPASPLLIFGYGPIPGFGIAGGGIAMIGYYAAGTILLAGYILTGRSTARFCLGKVQWRLVHGILRVGALSAITSVQTNVTIAGATALVASVSGVAAVAGFGTAARLEYLLIPLVFGIGAPLVALVGVNLGAGNRQRALHAALCGAALAFVLTESIGIVAAIWPQTWLTLFSDDPAAVQAGSAYLYFVGPFYGFFGLGMALYFASQGAGRLLWPLVSGFIRLVIALGGGWIALQFTGEIASVYLALGLALMVFGLIIHQTVVRGAWFS